MQQELTPSAGEQVITQDGEIIGEVKEVRGAYFKVDVSFGRDYWLDVSGVDIIEDGAVCLSFTKNELDSYKQSEPEQ